MQPDERLSGSRLESAGGASRIAVEGRDVPDSDVTTLARRLGLPVFRRESKTDASTRGSEADTMAIGTDDGSGPAVDAVLTLTPERLELALRTGAPEIVGGRPVFADPAALDARTAAGLSRKQPIVLACGLRKKGPKPFVLDGTAGYGEDAWLLAAMGCRVLAVERHPVVFALLEDGVRRVRGRYPEAGARLLARHADALSALRLLSEGRMAELLAGRSEGRIPGVLPDDLDGLPERPDVVYLDPMYPGADKRKTAERKPLKVLRAVVGEDADDGEPLLRAALAVARKRVVVKRPLRAEPLAALPAPTVVHKGKALRYDVYVVSA